MSNWTYVSGSCDIECSPYKSRLNKDGTRKKIKSGDYEGWVEIYTPYPEEQIKLCPPEARRKDVIRKDYNGKKYTEKNFPYLSFDVKIYAYPIIKRIIEELIKQMPSGENNDLEYNLVSVDWTRVGGDLDTRDKKTVDYIHKLIMTQYPSYTMNWKEYNEYRDYELNNGDLICDSYFSIQSNIRYTDASEFYDKLIWMFGEMAKRDITFNTGCFAWHDAYNIRYTMYIEGDEFTVEKYDSEKDTIERDYYQIFCYSHEDRDVTYELRKVDKFTDDHWIEENN